MGRECACYGYEGLNRAAENAGLIFGRRAASFAASGRCPPLDQQTSNRRARVPDPQAFARRAQVTAAETPRATDISTLLVAVVVIAALYLGREVLVPITLAIMLSFVLAPLVDRLRRLHLGRVPAVLLSIVVALAVILGLGGLIGMQLADLAQNVPSYQSTIEQKVDLVRTATLGRMTDVMKRVGTQLDHASAPAPAPATPRAPASAAPAAAKPTLVQVQQPDATPLEIAERVLSPVLGPLGTLGVIVIVAVFVLLQQEDLRNRMIRLFGSSDLHRTTIAMDDAAHRLSRYFLTQLAINAGFGLLIGIGLFAIGVPSPVLWAIIAALMRFVPYVGSVISAIFPIALSAAVDPGWSMSIWTVALFLVAESATGQIVEPMMYGHSTGLSPVSVVVSAIFWTWLWGPIGLVLSTPLTVCLVVLGRYVPRLEFLDVILGDRPALTPVERFYQRMLAGDPDEAFGQAEVLLKERSLSSYYDEIALKGLQLAGNDVARGVLTPEQTTCVRDAIEELVADLAGYDDIDPAPIIETPSVLGSEKTLPRQSAPDATAPPAIERAGDWNSDMPILCIAGRGALDEAASIMLAQLLVKHGLGAQSVPHNAVSRANIAALSQTGTAMVCISYLEISGSLSHLRLLVRRIRQRLPNAAIMVGLWPSEARADADQPLSTSVGADYYASSLREAVNACLRTEEQARNPTPAAKVA
jgi:predicted PurR-regulated permease PerM